MTAKIIILNYILFYFFFQIQVGFYPTSSVVLKSSYEHFRERIFKATNYFLIIALITYTLFFIRVFISSYNDHFPVAVIPAESNTIMFWYQPITIVIDVVIINYIAIIVIADSFYWVIFIYWIIFNVKYNFPNT